MPLPRVIIAAVFFVIGALIAIPALTRSSSSSHASNSASSSSATPSISTSGGHSGSASANPHGGKSSSPKASSSTSTKSTSPTTVPPSVTLTPTASPLSAIFSSVGCPTREVRATVTNTGTQTEAFSIVQDGSVVLLDRVAPQASRTDSVTLQEGVASKVSVVWNGRNVRTVSRTATCSVTTPPTNGKLPHTGPDSAGLYAKIATGIAAMITGVIVFWWGGIWPRRRESMFGDGGRETIQKSGDKVSH